MSETIHHHWTTEPSAYGTTIWRNLATGEKSVDPPPGYEHQGVVSFAESANEIGAIYSAAALDRLPQEAEIRDIVGTLFDQMRERIGLRNSVAVLARLYPSQANFSEFANPHVAAMAELFDVYHGQVDFEPYHQVLPDHKLKLLSKAFESETRRKVEPLLGEWEYFATRMPAGGWQSYIRKDKKQGWKRRNRSGTGWDYRDTLPMTADQAHAKFESMVGKKLNAKQAKDLHRELALMDRNELAAMQQKLGIKGGRSHEEKANKIHKEAMSPSLDLVKRHINGLLNDKDKADPTNAIASVIDRMGFKDQQKFAKSLGVDGVDSDEMAKKLVEQHRGKTEEKPKVEEKQEEPVTPKEEPKKSPLGDEANAKFDAIEPGKSAIINGVEITRGEHDTDVYASRVDGKTRVDTGGGMRQWLAERGEPKPSEQPKEEERTQNGQEPQVETTEKTQNQESDPDVRTQSDDDNWLTKEEPKPQEKPAEKMWPFDPDAEEPEHVKQAEVNHYHHISEDDLKGGNGEELKPRVFDSIDKNQNLSNEHKEKYQKEFHQATYHIPKKAMDLIDKHAKNFSFYSDKKKMVESIIDSARKKFVDTGIYKDKEKFEKQAEQLTMSADHVGGAFAVEDMHLDGGLEQQFDGTMGGKYSPKGRMHEHEIYAHELTHAIDGKRQGDLEKGKFSSTQDWLDIHKNEMGGNMVDWSSTPGERFPLTKYAGSIPHESFAEFGRILYGSGHSLEKIESDFPKASAFFKKYGLWPESKNEPEGGWEKSYKDIFKKRIDLGDDGSHADILDAIPVDEEEATKNTDSAKTHPGEDWLTKQDEEPVLAKAEKESLGWPFDPNAEEPEYIKKEYEEYQKNSGEQKPEEAKSEPPPAQDQPKAEEPKPDPEQSLSKEDSKFRDLPLDDHSISDWKQVKSKLGSNDIHGNEAKRWQSHWKEMADKYRESDPEKAKIAQANHDQLDQYLKSPTQGETQKLRRSLSQDQLHAIRTANPKHKDSIIGMHNMIEDGYDPNLHEAETLVPMKIKVALSKFSPEEQREIAKRVTGRSLTPEDKPKDVIADPIIRNWISQRLRQGITGGVSQQEIRQGTTSGKGRAAKGKGPSENVRQNNVKNYEALLNSKPQDGATEEEHAKTLEKLFDSQFKKTMPKATLESIAKSQGLETQGRTGPELRRDLLNNLHPNIRATIPERAKRTPRTQPKTPDQVHQAWNELVAKDHEPGEIESKVGQALNGMRRSDLNEIKNKLGVHNAKSIKDLKAKLVSQLKDKKTSQPVSTEEPKKLSNLDKKAPTEVKPVDSDEIREAEPVDVGMSQHAKIDHPHTKTKEFKNWFGDWEEDPRNSSKVVDPDTGKPIRLFHGTHGDFDQFDASQGKAASDQIGSWFADNPEFSNARTQQIDEAHGILKNSDPEKLSRYESQIGKNWRNQVGKGKSVPVFLNLRKPAILKNREDVDEFAAKHMIVSDEDLDKALNSSDNLNLDWVKSQPNYKEKYKRDPQFRKDVNDRLLFVQKVAPFVSKYVRQAFTDKGHDGIIVENDQDAGRAYVAFHPNQIKSASGNSGNYDPKDNRIDFAEDE